jgi:hypothetical protein
VVLGKSTFERHFLWYEQAGLRFLRESASLLLEQRCQAAKGWTSFPLPGQTNAVAFRFPSLKKGANLEANTRLCDPLDVSLRLDLPRRCPLQTGRCGYRGAFVP